MMYTRERLMKAVREAGRNGKPFTLGEVRAELGLKSRDKRELKRFRSRFRECSTILGANLEKLGPNTFRLTGAQLDPIDTRPAPQQAVLKPIKTSVRTGAIKKRPSAAQHDAAPPINLLARVAVVTEDDDPYTQKRRAREAISFDKAEPASTRAPSLGERVSSWFGRTPRTVATPTGGAATALSRLAVELQPKAASFEYRWINGKLQVQRAADK